MDRLQNYPEMNEFALLAANMRRKLILLLCLLLVVPAWVSAQSSFVVRDMRVEGLQRISEGTVFNYVPINIGDTVDEVRIQEAIRALYSQALFDDIEVRRDGDTLVIAVRERPSIESFTIDGNKDIKTEDLMESLRSVGLSRGRTFDRSVLDNVQMFLTALSCNGDPEADIMVDPECFDPNQPFAVGKCSWSISSNPPAGQSCGRKRS